MKTISSALALHFGLGCTTLATIWKVKRQDGTILGFTNHDQDLIYDDGVDSVTYQGATGMTPSAAETSAGMATDNMDVTAFLDADSISDSDIRAGLYNFADIEIRVVNWSDLSNGDLKLRKGTLGIVKMQNGQFTAEIRGLSFYFATVIGKTYGPICRADYGDADCGVDVAALAQTGTVDVDVDTREFTATGLTDATPNGDFFIDGVLTWLTGANTGAVMEAVGWDRATSMIRLFESMAGPIAPGDTFTLEPGCDHTIKGCQRNNNIVNFRGEPYIPGQDAILSYPTTQG